MLRCFRRRIKPRRKQLKLMFWEGYGADPVNRAYLGFGLKSGLQIPWYSWNVLKGTPFSVGASCYIPKD